MNPFTHTHIHSLSLSLSHTHTHTQRYRSITVSGREGYWDVCVCVCVCVCTVCICNDPRARNVYFRPPPPTPTPSARNSTSDSQAPQAQQQTNKFTFFILKVTFLDKFYCLSPQEGTTIFNNKPQNTENWRLPPGALTDSTVRDGARRRRAIVYVYKQEAQTLSQLTFKKKKKNLFFHTLLSPVCLEGHKNPVYRSRARHQVPVTKGNVLVIFLECVLVWLKLSRPCIRVSNKVWARMDKKLSRKQLSVPSLHRHCDLLKLGYGRRNCRNNEKLQAAPTIAIHL